MLVMEVGYIWVGHSETCLSSHLYSFRLDLWIVGIYVVGSNEGRLHSGRSFSNVSELSPIVFQIGLMDYHPNRNLAAVRE